jgi:hypothetical protein
MTTPTKTRAGKKNVPATAVRQNDTGTATIVGFDYEQLSHGVAAVAREAADRIRSRLSNSLIDTGKDLRLVRERLEHGQFGAWLRVEFGLTARTAQRYMRAARLADKIDTVSDLTPTALYALSAATTPKEARKNVIRRLKAGETLQRSEIFALIRQAKTETQDTPTASVAKRNQIPARDGKSGRPVVRIVKKLRRLIRKRREPADGEYFCARIRRVGDQLIMCRLMPDRLVDKI